MDITSIMSSVSSAAQSFVGPNAPEASPEAKTAVNANADILANNGPTSRGDSAVRKMARGIENGESE